MSPPATISNIKMQVNKQNTPLWQKRDWQMLGLLVVISCLLYLPGLNLFGILDPSDGYYAEASREMIELGNYLTPHLNYRPWFEKPILIYWLIITSYSVFGINEVAARMPSVLSAISLVAYSFILGRQFLRRRAAFLSSCIIAASPLLLITGHLCLTDVPLCFCLWLGLGGLIAAICLKQSKAAKFSFQLSAYMGIGFGVLCKGPIALILVGINILAFLLTTSKSKQEFWTNVKSTNVLMGIFVVGLIALPWYLTETYITNGVFFNEFFIRQNLGRAIGAVTHQSPPWYYVPYLLGGFAPWTLVLALAWPTLAKVRKNRLSELSRYKFLFFCLVVSVTTFGFYSVVSSKMPTYILPVLPALAFLCGSALDTCMAAKLQSGWQQILFSRKVVTGFVASVLVLLAVATPVGLKVFYDAQWKDFHQLLASAQKRNQEPIIIGRFTPSANFYLHRQLIMIRNRTAFRNFIANANSPKLLLVSKQRMNYLSMINEPSRVIEQKGKWSLVLIEKKVNPNAVEPPPTDEMILPGSSTKVGD
jgi:4-amino-4-deoxy-L-arabinose transferase-like glycosyltransferase